MGLFSGSFGTGFVTGLASSVDKSMRDALERRSSELSEARKYIKTRNAAKEDAYQARKLKVDQENEEAFELLAAELGGDADFTAAAFERLGNAEKVKAYLANVDKTRANLQPGQTYNAAADFEGYVKGKTPITQSAFLAGKSPEAPNLTVSPSMFEVDDPIGRLFGKEGQAAKRAADRMNETISSTASAARPSLTGMGTVSGLDFTRQVAAQEAGFAATKREREEKRFDMEVGAFDQNKLRLEEQMKIARDVEARAKDKALSDAEQRKLDNARNKVADLQRKEQLVREAEMFVIDKQAKKLGIEVDEYALQKSKEAPQFNDYEEMAVFYSNKLGEQGLTTQQKNDFEQLRDDAIAGAAAFNAQTGGGSFFADSNRDSLVNNEIKRMLEPVGMMNELGQQIEAEIEGNLPVYFDNMQRALDNLAYTTGPLNDGMINRTLKGQRDALKAKKNQYKRDFAAPKEAADFDEFKSDQFKSTLEIGDVVKYTTDNGNIAVRIWTGNRYIN